MSEGEVGLGEQSVTPVQRGLERLLALRTGPAAPNQQAQAVVEPRRECFRRQTRDVRRRQFDREGDTV
jgi:hypothetical protein